MTIHILIINFNNAAYTIGCIESILDSNFQKFQIHLLDNRSEKNDLEKIKKRFSEARNHYYQSVKNLGFAGGNNYLLKKIMPHARPDDQVLFLNNDTKIDKNLLKIFAENSKTFPIMAAKTLKMDDPDKIDNLGMTISKTCLAKNRISEKDKFFGPCGCCAAFTVEALRKIKEKTGDYFDDDYFCYCEDADLIWRAGLIGINPTYIPEALCYHKGGATTGSDFNKFIMYHTLRNTLYNITKNLPATKMILQSPWIVGFQIALIFRYLLTRKLFTLLKVYRDFLKNLPKLLKKRHLIQKNRCTY